MKTFDGFLQTEDLHESRFLRKTTTLLLASQSKKHGDYTVRHLKSAQQKFKGRPLDTAEERIEKLSEGFDDLCEGLIVRETGRFFCRCKSLRSVDVGTQQPTVERPS